MTLVVCVKTSHFVASVYVLLYTCLLLRLPDYVSLLEKKRRQMPPKRKETDTLFPDQCQPIMATYLTG